MRIGMRTFFSLATVFVSFSVASQNVLITDPDYDQASPLDCNIFNNGSVQNLFDSGGGAQYGANENETIVLCPDLVNGSKVTVTFATNVGYVWDVDGSDTLYIYDGPNTSSPLMGAINSVTNPNGGSFQASFQNNPSGCLTLEFISDGAIQADGWAGNVSCGNPPQPYEAHMIAFINGDIAGGDDLDPADTGYVDVCQGDSVMFVATPVFPYDPSITGTGYDQINNYTVNWTFSDGTTATGDTAWFFPPSPAGFLATLEVSDPFPQTEGIISKVRVSTTPDFSTCMPLEDSICLGGFTQLLGGITGQDTVGVDPTESSILIGGTFTGITYLPDGSGAQYQTSVNISGFPPGMTVSSAADILSMCVTIEHSYLGDLEMVLECPNGQSTVIFNSYGPGGMVAGGFGGGSTFLGQAFDNNIGNPGTGWEYCFYDGAPNPAWVFGYPTTPVTNPSNGNAITAGDYEPEQSFANFIGCPLNGNWTITVQDNLGIDDGYIFEWGITFDPLLNPNNESYSPTIVSEHWQSDPDIWTMIGNGQWGENDTAIFVTPDSLGWNSYTFVVTDNFGCSYDTTIQVYATPGATIMPDTVTCNNTINISGTASTQGGTWVQYSGPGNSTFSPSATDDNPTISVDAPGVYIYQYTDAECGNVLGLTVEYLEDPQASIEDAVICPDQTYEWNAAYAGSTYQWFLDGVAIAGATNAQYTASEPGLYMVEVTNECNTVSDNAMVEIDPCEIEIPNIIDPNGDGLNDEFQIVGLENYTNRELSIFNRWGKLVYFTNDYQNDWDGTSNITGKEVSDGVYYWILKAQKPYSEEVQIEKGHVTVVRPQ